MAKCGLAVPQSAVGRSRSSATAILCSRRVSNCGSRESAVAPLVPGLSLVLARFSLSSLTVGSRRERFFLSPPSPGNGGTCRRRLVAHSRGRFLPPPLRWRTPPPPRHLGSVDEEGLCCCAAVVVVEGRQALPQFPYASRVIAVRGLLLEFRGVSFSGRDGASPTGVASLHFVTSV